MSASMEFLYGSATGVGSLPHGDEAAALKIIRENLSCGPHWPQLPNMGEEEGFARQYLTPLIDLNILVVNEGEAPYFSDQAQEWPEREQAFYELYLEAQEGGEAESRVLELFAFPRDCARGFYSFLEEDWSSAEAPLFVKGQISGPLSLGLQLTSTDGKAAFYHPGLRDILVKCLALHAKWQVRALKKFALPVVVFIDEPALLAFGQSMYASLSAEDIAVSLEEIVSAIHEEGGIAGVHCCAGVDWSILFNLPLEIVNFDAYSYFDSLLVYAEEADAFLKRGGVLAWGLAPTTADVVDKADLPSLRKMFAEEVQRLEKRGLDPELLRRQFMLTPSCGAATLSIEQAERVYKLVSELRAALG